MSKKTQQTAVKYMKELFDADSGVDTLSRDELFTKLNRDGNNERDQAAVSNRLSIMRKFGLIDTRYDFIGRTRMIDRVILTNMAKVVLGRDSQTTEPRVNPSSAQREITPESVLADVRILQKQNPSFNVRLVFEPKEEPMEHS